MEQCRRDDYDPDASLEYSEEETYQQFLDFYEDVLPEFRNVGKVVQFKVGAHSARGGGPAQLALGCLPGLGAGGRGPCAAVRAGPVDCHVLLAVHETVCEHGSPRQVGRLCTSSVPLRSSFPSR